MAFFWSEIGSGFGEPDGSPPPPQESPGVPPGESLLYRGYQNCRLMLTVKNFHGISNLTISGDFHGETSSHVLKNTLCRHNKTLQLVILEGTTSIDLFYKNKLLAFATKAANLYLNLWAFRYTI